MDHINLLRH
jgi:hypothetical protein